MGPRLPGNAGQGLHHRLDAQALPLLGMACLDSRVQQPSQRIPDLLEHTGSGDPRRTRPAEAQPPLPMSTQTVKPGCRHPHRGQVPGTALPQHPARCRHHHAQGLLDRGFLAAHPGRGLACQDLQVGARWKVIPGPAVKLPQGPGLGPPLVGDLTGLLDRSIRVFQGGTKGCPYLLIGSAPLPFHDDLGVLEHLAHGLPDACPAPLLVEGHQKSPGGKAPPFPIGHENGWENDAVRVLVGFPRPVFAVVHLNGERPPRNVLGAILLVLASGAHAGWLHPENFLHGSHHFWVIDLRIHPAILDRVADLDRRRNNEFREPSWHGASHRQQLIASPV